MFRTVDISLHERGVVFKDQVPVRALAPGRHSLWGFGLTVNVLDTSKVVLDAAPEVRAVLPAAWFSELVLAEDERGVVKRAGKPILWLRPGVHRLWRVDPDITVEVLSTGGPVPSLTLELRKILPAGEIFETVVGPTEVGILFEAGRVDRVLSPGIFAAWNTPEAPVHVLRVDVRRQEVAIVGQELMTRDKVSLRLNLTAEIKVVDAVVATQSVVSAKDAIYLSTQLAARSLVAAMTLDELLESREAIADKIHAMVSADAAAIGVELHHVGIKDVVLPGEMKTLLNRVIEAEKEAAANVIRRREETAATRQLANTARLMAETPMLVRMRELEMLKDIAGQLKEVKLVVGTDKLEALLPKDLLK